MLVDACIGRAARRRIDDRIAENAVSFRAGFLAQYAGVNLTWAEARQLLFAKNNIDHTFPHLVQWAVAADIPLVVLSSGFEQIIREYLTPLNLPPLEIRANRVQIEGRRWRVHFRDETPFGHDKAAALQEARRQGYRVVFIGDGISDIPAATKADHLFARRGQRLADYCRQNDVPFVPFTAIGEVAAHLAVAENFPNGFIRQCKN